MDNLKYRAIYNTIGDQITTPVDFYQLSDREIVIATEPETVVIIGYEELGSLFSTI